MIRATAYLRTSSATNVDGDSPHRQNDAVMGYASRHEIEVVSCFWDAAVSGSDPIEDRDGFAAMLQHCEVEGISVVLVEDASRFARKMITQELGVELLKKRGIRLIGSDGTELTLSSASKNAHRHMLGLMAEYEKTVVVERLRNARERIKDTGAKCEGRKSHAELHPDLTREARRLARKSPKTGKARSLRQIADELASLGFVAASGKALSPSIIMKLVA